MKQERPQKFVLSKLCDKFDMAFQSYVYQSPTENDLSNFRITANRLVVEYGYPDLFDGPTSELSGSPETEPPSPDQTRDDGPLHNGTPTLGCGFDY